MTRDKKSIDSTQEDILETIDVGGNGVDEFDVECMEGICSGGESSNPRAGDKELVEKLRLKVEDKMKELLNEEEQKYLELVGNVRLLRFLLAYKRDLEQAATAYEAFLNWYSENKIGDIRRDIVKNHITFDNIPLGVTFFCFLFPFFSFFSFFLSFFFLKKKQKQNIIKMIK